jgi:vacuolar-type H+-ATPase subunit E/Vma4
MTMSIDPLLGLLTREAEAEAESVLATARRQASELEGNAEALADRRRAEARARQRETRRRQLRREAAAIDRRQRETMYRERAELLKKIFARAEDTRASVPVDRYVAMLDQLVASALEFLGDAPAVLHCRPDAAARLEKVVAGRNGVTVVPRADAAAGVFAEAADGHVMIDNTLPGLLRRRAPALAIELAGKLGAGA